MRRTLFLIPHEVAGLPLFGVGWLLIGLAIFVIARLIWATRSKNPNVSVGSVVAGEGIVWAVFAALIVLALPRAELANIDGDPIGLPVRGYGLFLMLAAIGSVGIAAWRAERAGLGSEMILRLAPWTFVGGLVGARLFYVIQYRDDFMRATLSETVMAMAAFTQGGLVVYGGFIGGFFASVWAVRRFRGSMWQFGDVIVPCIFVGLFFGRLGCLMNGCCYGGTCEPNSLSVRFPPGSNVYADQLLSGTLIGMQTKPIKESADERSPGGRSRLTVISVDEGSLADRAGVRPDDSIELVLDSTFMRQAPKDIPADAALPGVAIVREGELLARVSPSDLPARAGPVWATQIISSVGAAILFFTLLGVERILRATIGYRDGVLMLLGFIAYAVLRIVMEWVRVDEAGQFGTSLSISQWVSFIVITLCLIALAWRLRSEPFSPKNVRTG